MRTTESATLQSEPLLHYTERLARGGRFMVDTFGNRLAPTILILVLFASAGGCGSDKGEDAADAARPGGVAATDATRPETAAQQQDERAVDSESLPYAEVDNELVYGHFAFPSDMIEPLPAVVIVHDWWGLNEHVKTEANRVAAAGYIVLAVDLYGGKVVNTPETARANMIDVVENPHLVEDNLRQAIEFVGVAGAPQVATLGWGLGGGWALDAARLFPGQVDAAIVYYGQVSDDENRLADISAPVLGFFGERDRGIKIESVKRFESAMQRLRKDVTLHIFEDTGHGFVDPARGTYRAELAADTWQRMMDFLASNLSVADDS